MYVEIKESEGKKKYYLTHSYRKGKKVRKVRIYLGIGLAPKELKKKIKEAEEKIKQRVKAVKVIHDPLQTVLSSSEIDELKTLEAKGTIKIHHLSEEEWLEFTEDFTYDTNAIEGSTITGSEVKCILEKDKWPRDKSKNDISETYGVAEAVGYIRKTKEHISLKLIRELHEIVFRNSKPFAGKFRKIGMEVVVADAAGKIVHRGAPSTHITSLLQELVKWYNKNKSKYPPLVLAAVVHNQFENIHPFQDGNGRVGRLLMNNILLKHGKPPLNIELKNRSGYYAALQAYEKNHDLRPMLELMIREYRALRRLLKKRKK